MKSAWDFAADMIDPPDSKWRPEPHQMPPLGDWFAWLLLGGRGAGKTASAAKYTHDHINGPPCLPDVPGGHWVGLIGPTLGDTVTSCVYGPSGLRAHDPGVKVRQTAGGTTVKWSNGAEGKLFGAHTPEDVERLRSGGNRCFVWAEELAAWRYMEDCWQHMRYGLRVGPWPHVVISTTPKNRVLIKELVKKAREAYRDPESGQIEVVVTRATTEHNPHLDPRIKRMLFEDYGGTRLGRQELYAEILEDVQGALWKAADIDNHRLSRNVMPTKFDKIVVGVDPAASSLGDECGIVVAGIVGPGWRVPDQNHATEVAHGFVLADYTIQGSPQVWSREVVRAYDDWGANLVVAEINNGGEMVTSTIHNVRDTIPVKTEHATRGKTRRAEPVSLLYEQGRVHHVGVFGKLEDQMTGWDAVDPDDSWSPDRMDALVWALTNLMSSTQRTVMTSVHDTRLRGTR